MPIEDPAETQARYWLMRQRSGELSESELREFEAWLEADPNHRAAFDRVSALWDSLDEFRERQFPARLAARNFRRSPRLSWLASAVTVVLMLAITFSFISLREWQGEVGTYRSAKGEQRLVTLADGSTALLDTDTELRVVYSRKARTISLERGQALFSVEKDIHRPFEVIAASGRIVALGTQFDVRLRDDRTKVAVTEGIVSVTTTRTGPIHVVAGEGMSWSHRGDYLGHHLIDAETTLAWREGRLRFKDTPLSEVMAEIARYHAVSYSFADPSLATLEVSGSFRSDDLQRILAGLEAALPMRVSIQGTLIRLEPRTL
jgi:transmembrane sensor